MQKKTSLEPCVTKNVLINRLPNILLKNKLTHPTNKNKNFSQKFTSIDFPGAFHLAGGGDRRGAWGRKGAGESGKD